MEPDGIRNAGCSTADLQDFSFSLYLSFERKIKERNHFEIQNWTNLFLKKGHC
jgi:hypothetical protein